MAGAGAPIAAACSTAVSFEFSPGGGGAHPTGWPHTAVEKAAHLLSKTPVAAPLLPPDPALTVEQVHLQDNTNTYVKHTQV